MVVVQQSQDGISLPPIKDSPTDRYRDSYRLELDHFIEVLEGVEKRPQIYRCTHNYTYTYIQL